MSSIKIENTQNTPLGTEMDMDLSADALMLYEVTFWHFGVLRSVMLRADGASVVRDLDVDGGLFPASWLQMILPFFSGTCDILGIRPSSCAVATVNFLFGTESQPTPMSPETPVHLKKQARTRV